MNWPIFFDQFGVIIWIALIIDAGLQIRGSPRKVHWRTWCELALGITGLLVDGTMVLGTNIGWLRL